jgi:type IV secretory pathway VirB3-like protein
MKAGGKAYIHGSNIYYLRIEMHSVQRKVYMDTLPVTLLGVALLLIGIAIGYTIQFFVSRNTSFAEVVCAPIEKHVFAPIGKYVIAPIGKVLSGIAAALSKLNTRIWRA